VILDILYISFIFIIVIIGLIFTKKSSLFSYKLLLLFLIVTFLNESICFYIKIKHLGSTYIFYNFYYYFRFPLLGWMFLFLLPNKVQKSIIYIFLALSFFLFLFNSFYLYGFNSLHSNYLLSGGVFIILLSLIHFYNILKNSKKKNPLTTPFFWVSTGLFFYFLGIQPFFGIINVLLKKDIIFVAEYLIIIKSLSIFLYTLIGIDFYFQWKNLKSGL
jgi:hypothetical protein